MITNYKLSRKHYCAIFLKAITNLGIGHEQIELVPTEHFYDFLSRNRLKHLRFAFLP